MLCHEKMPVAARMARRWHQGGAAVAIHTDRKIGPQIMAEFRAHLVDLPNIHHVEHRRDCEWGMFSLVEATLDAAAQLLALHPDVTHVLLASGSCLPLRPIADLRAYLALDPRRDYIESVTAHDVGWTVGGLNEERFTLRFPFSWRKRRWLFDRFVDLQRRYKLHRHIPDGLVPHLGSQWWCLTRRTLEAILNDPRRDEIDHYFRYVWVPDESYFQTLVRRHSTTIESRSLTLSKFDSQGKPYTFYDDHLQMLEDSGCFVARKIWPRARALLSHFPRPVGEVPSTAEPQPAHIDRLINRAVARRDLGRPGLYMQSRFPRKDKENGKTAAAYALFQGFNDIFPDFEDWLAERVDADVHGHLFGREAAEFAGRTEIGPGGLSWQPALRDHDPQGFLASLIRMSRRRQVFMQSPRDHQTLDWFMATDPNCSMYIITGAWMIPLMGSEMPFDDVRRIAAHLQRRESHQIEVLRSVWTKARVRRWDLADFLARPGAILDTVVAELGRGPVGTDDIPAMRPVDGMPHFLQALRNAGLQPQLTGDFPTPAPKPRIPKSPPEAPADA
ncbi:glycosyl transferase [Paracoccus suum]|uniref:Peptide O-xylosyltransferase n=2 Tax=Paracoccus suum TaxID=2259340 RepID=A0A344PNS0_9RHOB|nr:beta-1,6-N-acetylglucosaminyltransferase [Paracoccus suum]AXC51025.1 glycosyl transferase [Paracoccus suum]